MADYEKLAENLGPELGNWSTADAANALRYYGSGNSTQLAARETGIPIRRIDRWIELAGLKRTKGETSRVRSAKALDQWARR